MLSGPDLGAGYLHQLTIDRNETTTTFTYHAQDGGQDANGPPIGPLDVLGFVHPPAGCQFGGPRCWHRRFLVPFGETLKVRMAYNRFRFVLEAMLEQAHRGRPVALETAVTELVRRIDPTLRAEGIEWYIGGSAAARLLGAELTPRDVDLGTSRPGVDRIAELIPEYLIEPVGPTDWSGGRIVRGARAFVGTFRDGARVEWAVPLEPDGSAVAPEWAGDLRRVRTLEVDVGGTHVRVTRPEYGLVRAAERERSTAVAEYAKLARRLGPDPALLESLLAAKNWPEARRQALARIVAV
jgi:hypothetical protein